MRGSLSLPLLPDFEPRLEALSRCLVLAAIIVAFALRIYRLDYQSLWEDEIHSVLRGNMSLADMLQDVLQTQNHVPLYFAMMHYWQQFTGDREFAVRFFSLFWGVLSVAAIFRLGITFGRRSAGLIGALLLAISPFHVWYSQEARMYTMVTFFMLGANYFFVKVLRGDSLREWFGYAVCTLLAIYTHYFACLIPLSHFLFLFLNRRALKTVLLKWLIWMGAIASAYLPWIVTVILARAHGAHGPNIGWIAPIRWMDPLLTLYVFGLGATADPRFTLNYLSALTLLSVLSLAIFQILRGNKLELEGQMLVHWLLTPLLLISIISCGVAMQHHFSLYMDRYLIIISPAFLILVAYGLSSLARWHRGLAMVASAIMLISITLSLHNLYFSPEYHREDWRGASVYLRKQGRPNDVLIVSSDPHFAALVYYPPGEIPCQIVPFSALAEASQAYLSQKAHSFVSQDGTNLGRLWVISALDNMNPHGFPYERNAYIAKGCPFDRIKAWFDSRYQILQEKTFNGICLALYDNERRSDE